MCLRKIAIPLAACLCLLFISCTSNAQIIINNNDKDKLSAISDSIELKFAEDRTIWHYYIQKGEILLKSTQTIPPAYFDVHPHIYFPQDIPKGLPEITGYIFYGPYCFSPDKSHIVVSLSPVEDRMHATDFAVIRLDTKQILFQTKNNNVWDNISDIAWSPDSKIFAILNSSAERKYSPIDIFSAIFGLYRDHLTFFLSIYDLNGTLVVKNKIASNIINGSGQIIWNTK